MCVLCAVCCVLCVLCAPRRIPAVVCFPVAQHGVHVLDHCHGAVAPIDGKRRVKGSVTGLVLGAWQRDVVSDGLGPVLQKVIVYGHRWALATRLFPREKNEMHAISPQKKKRKETYVWPPVRNAIAKLRHVLVVFRRHQSLGLCPSFG